MLAIERRNKILEKMQAERQVLVSELAALFGITEETIRRDLDKLERDGLVKRTYGGAILQDAAKTELSHSIRRKRNVTAKQKIARLAAGLVNDGDHIMLDDSSTAYFVARELRQRENLTVITNSIEVILELADVPGWNIMATGGTLREKTLALVGTRAEQMLRSYHVDKAIISCNGLQKERGFMESSEQNAQVKSAMMAAARETILAVDSTKFEKPSFVQFGALEQLTAVVTDKAPDRTWRETLKKLDVACIYSSMLS